MKKILLIGANGQLAHDLINVLNKSSEVTKATRDDFDVTNYSACLNFFTRVQPDVVINTAAYHKTEDCEKNPDISFQVNAIGAYNVSHAAAEVNAKIIFLSTDYIFDGKKKKYYEDDKTNPLNVYGASKLAGEILTKIANNNYYIVRTTGLFGEKISGKGHNFVQLMLDKAKTEKIIKVVNDQYCSPTYSFDLAGKITELIDKDVPSETYHIVNSGSCSWYYFAKKIFALAGIKVKLIPVSSNSFTSIVKRPQYSVLASKNLNKVGISPLRKWEEAVLEYIQSLNF